MRIGRTFECDARSRSAREAWNRAQNRTLIDESRRNFLRSNLIESKKQPQFCLLDALIQQATIDHELNSDSHSRRFIVITKGRQAGQAIRSCGLAPTPKRASRSRCLQPSRTAGVTLASSLRAVGSTRAPGAEFISVSGFRPDRSALHSDMRLSKRTSGSAAATEPLHAPMNSPKGARLAASRGFPFHRVH